MNCDEFEERAQRCLDQRLPLASDSAMEQHAEDCRHCRNTLEAYADLHAGLSAWDTPELAAGFAQRVVAELAPPRPVARSSFGRLALAAVAAGILAALFPVLRDALHPSPPRHQPPVAAAPSPEPGLAAPDRLTQAPDLAAIAAVPRGFLGVSSRLVPAPLGTWHQWMTSLARGQEELLAPMDGLTEGIRPITTTLTGTIDALRDAIPLGEVAPAKDASGDSAGLPPGHPRGPAV